ncbi:DUF202 domain-containing protein [Nocardioides sp. 616]|uniref:YidH family protein n=1 Tax=Nocardioides sp. 616 TaxID=2268090 RepID=UPI000CE3C200|nr:DUF202 domain-containing protein [Nocardioides sp. 616]
MPSKRSPWPGWVYRSGQDAPYQSSLSNERTFLAWIHTSLALLATGVGLDVVDLSIPDAAKTAISVALVLLALATAVFSWVRWATTERAMRLNQTLPSPGYGVLLVVVVSGIAAVLIVSWL